MRSKWQASGALCKCSAAYNLTVTIPAPLSSGQTHRYMLVGVDIGRKRGGAGGKWRMIIKIAFIL